MEECSAVEGAVRAKAGYLGDLREVYILDRDGTVSLLPCMTTARAYHGVIQVFHIYVFGGCRL